MEIELGSAEEWVFKVVFEFIPIVEANKDI